MTPARGDHEARRADVSEAVWRVLANGGFGALTLRAVAAEMGASTGLLTHYFPNKRALVRHALEVLDRRSAGRARPGVDEAAPGLATLRAVLLDILPLTAEGAADNRIWVASWDVALADPELAAEHAERYRRSRLRMAGHVARARRLGELPAEPGPVDPAAGVGVGGLGGTGGAGGEGGEGGAAGAGGEGAVDPADLEVAAAVQSYVLGLVVQALFAPQEFPPERQIRLVDRYLAALSAAAAPGAVPGAVEGRAPGCSTG
ncbi:TetR family transcriptional regulator C-terminal domain-containing protein [Kitasatospora sp. NPDC049258]|uniref:TetR/AcrR family transcriptional regulator n=1 Tax=Kitasatospora sp. NPDC049258 TaxID=3155394 RepID=UPI00344049E5